LSCDSGLEGRTDKSINPCKPFAIEPINAGIFELAIRGAEVIKH
jgi:hypothetical protein